MSTVIVRRVAAMPVRTASATWKQISEILAPDESSAERAELNKVSGVAAASIASEAPANDPIVVRGGGARVRIYCLYNDEAISGEGQNEKQLQSTALKDDWLMSIPFEERDLAWARAELSRLSSRVTAYEVGTDIEDARSESESRITVTHSIDVEEFLKS